MFGQNSAIPNSEFLYLPNFLDGEGFRSSHSTKTDLLTAVDSLQDQSSVLILLALSAVFQTVHDHALLSAPLPNVASLVQLFTGSGHDYLGEP